MNTRMFLPMKIVMWAEHPFKIELCKGIICSKFFKSFTWSEPKNALNLTHHEDELGKPQFKSRIMTISQDSITTWSR